MVRVPYFYGNLLMQPFIQSPSTILSSISTIFLLSVSLHYLFAKPSIQSSQWLPSYITQLFFIFLLVTAIPTIPTKNPFSYLNHSADSGCFGGPMSGTLVRIYTILFSPCFPGPVSQYLIVQSQKICVSHIVAWWRWLQSEWEICSLPYPQSIIITSIPYEYISQDLRYRLRLLFQQIQFSYQAWHSKTLFIVHPSPMYRNTLLSIVHPSPMYRNCPCVLELSQGNNLNTPYTIENGKMLSHN